MSSLSNFDQTGFEVLKSSANDIMNESQAWAAPPYLEDIVHTILKKQTLQNFREVYFGVTVRANIKYPNIFTKRHFSLLIGMTRDYRNPITEEHQRFIYGMLNRVWTPIMMQYSIGELRAFLDNMQLQKQDFESGQFNAPQKAVQHIVYVLEAYDLC